MPIRFTSQNIDFELPQTEKVKKWITQVVLQRGKRVGNISYLFCDDEYLLGVNQRFLNHDTYTDIITFDYSKGDKISGDLFVSIDSVRENANEYKVDFKDELYRVIVHGILHLIGYDDHTPEEIAQMRAKEDYYLSVREAMFGFI